jgi:calpain-7
VAITQGPNIDSKWQEQEQLIALRSGEEALQHAIKAAELYMKALAEAPTDGPDKVRLSRKCRELLALAEKLKKTETSFKEPRSTRQLPTAEKILLLRSSKLHGNTFPPWESNPPASDFMRAGSEMPLYTYASASYLMRHSTRCGMAG